MPVPGHAFRGLLLFITDRGSSSSSSCSKRSARWRSHCALVFPLTLVLICFYAIGIAWFHWHWGFFIVVPGDFQWEPDEWGWKHSLLLIACLAATSRENRANLFGIPRMPQLV